MTITYINGNASNGAVTVNLTGNFAVNDLICVGVYGDGVPGGGITPVFADNLNSGNYSCPVSVNETGQGRQYMGAWIACNAAASSFTLTVSCAALSAYTGAWFVAHYTGFEGAPTYAGGGNAAYQSSSKTITPTGTSFNTTQPNELVCAFIGSIDATNIAWATAPASPWVNEAPATGNTVVLADQIVSTAGTSIGITGTLSAADFWWAVQMGFYDASAAPSAPLISSLNAFGIGPG
jgi:hypothetical protein